MLPGSNKRKGECLGCFNKIHIQWPKISGGWKTWVELHPRKPTYALKIDGWKMIHVLLKWSLFQGTNSFIFGDVWKLEICGVIAGDDATLPVSRLVWEILRDFHHSCIQNGKHWDFLGIQCLYVSRCTVNKCTVNKYISLLLYNYIFYDIDYLFIVFIAHSSAFLQFPKPVAVSKHQCPMLGWLSQNQWGQCKTAGLFEGPGWV